jgi:hypothetical protein
LSANKEGEGGYHPARPARLTTDEFERLANVFKDLLAEQPVVKAAIIFAGIGGVIELIHTLWLAIRYLAKF